MMETRVFACENCIVPRAIQIPENTDINHRPSIPNIYR
jgi:hypothetical protein